MQDLKSNLYYLDSFTCILMPTAAIAPCLHSSTPIYRTTDGEMVTYTPNRVAVIVETSTIKNNNQTGGKKGIYQAEIIKKWLETSFIQHNLKHSFEILMGNMCRGSSCNGQYLTHAEYNNVLFDQFKKIENLMDPSHGLL